MAYDSYIMARKYGTATLKFMSDCGSGCILKLLIVLYVPGLTRCLFSVESFTMDGDYEISFKGGIARITFDPKITKTLILPSANQVSVMRNALSTQSLANIDPQCMEVSVGDKKR